MKPYIDEETMDENEVESTESERIHDPAELAILGYHALQPDERARVFAWVVDQFEQQRHQLEVLGNMLARCRKNEKAALELLHAQRTTDAARAIKQNHREASGTVERTRCPGEVTDAPWSVNSFSAWLGLPGDCTLQLRTSDIEPDWSAWRASLVHHDTLEVVPLSGSGSDDMSAIEVAGLRRVVAVVVEWTGTEGIDLGRLREWFPSALIVEMGKERAR